MRSRNGAVIVGLMLGLLLGHVAATAAPAEGMERPEWAATLEQVAEGVVAIKVDLTRAFDTEWAASAQATGFVVDAQQGLILTNRHVVTQGPVTAQAVFVNHEEVELTPVYRDPVHDFGFYRYDPKKLRFMHPRALALDPAGAKVGTEIRVVGNDAGEQLSILAGTLARLDRDAPAYGAGKYNDFNTFYYQAASSTSGGSSGSPVVDLHGRAVALNAGGASQAASSFYLPLDRVVRALALVREGKPVPRGTLQTIFGFTAYDELHRLGLDSPTEASVRAAFPHQTGMLVVKEVQPGSAAAPQLAPGDILLRINGRYVTEFLSLEALLDDSVGQELELEIERGGERLVRTLRVDDLYTLAPDEYITVGESILHPLSYQMARPMNVPVKGIYVAGPGYMLGTAGVPRAAVITSFDGHPVTTLDELEKVLGGLADGDRATVRYFTADDTRSQTVRSVRIDRHWFAPKRCKRDASGGHWTCRALPDGPAPSATQPVTTTVQSIGDPVADRVASSLVMVNYDAPFMVSGISGRSYHGTGLVVDAQKGLVVADRDTAPLSLGDVRLTFGGTVEIPAKVVYVHPLHNLAIIAYDPKLIGETPVKAARLSMDDLHAGDEVAVVGLKGDQRLASIQTRVSAVDEAAFPLSHSLEFRETNVSLTSLVNPPADFDGVVVDRKGDVRALWSSFVVDNGRGESRQEAFGQPAALVTAMLEAYRSGQPLRSLDVELQPVPLSFARKLGLDNDWIRRLAELGGDREVMGIERTVGGTPAEHLLQSGDLLLAIDGHPLGRYRDIDAASQKPQLHLTVLRNGHEAAIDLPTTPLTGVDLERVILWSGAALQAPHRAMAAQLSTAPEGVLVSYYTYGSPASRYGLWAGLRILEVDGRPTPDLDTFLQAVSGRPAGESLRLKVINWNKQSAVITLRPDPEYFPTVDWRRTDTGWTSHGVP